MFQESVFKPINRKTNNNLSLQNILINHTRMS